MILLELFLSFLEIGAVSFGGGYAMIPLIMEKATAHGWMSEEDFLNIVAVAESTPGPIAINAATFIGSSQAGFLGALCATVGVVLPALIIILLIAAIVRNLIKYKPVQAFLAGLRPCIVGLIISTGFLLLLKNLIGISSVSGVIDSGIRPDFRGLVILALLVAANFAFWLSTHKKRKFPPILMIIFAAILGMLLY